MDCPVPDPIIKFQMVGKYIVIIVTVSEEDDAKHGDSVYVYDFVSDTLLMYFRAPESTYQEIIFLDENLILLPNQRKGRLDIFRIPPQPTLDWIRPLLSLHLPILRPEFDYNIFVAYADPHPLGESAYADMHHRSVSGPRNSQCDTFRPERGFFKRSKESICIFDLQAITDDNRLPQYAEIFNFIVHSSALLEIVARFDEPPSSSEITSNLDPSPPYLWPEYRILPMKDPLFGRVPDEFKTKYLIQSDSEDEDSGDVFWELPTPHHCIPWENWWPSITRWFRDLHRQQQCVFGERYVQLTPQAYESEYGVHPDGIPYVVMDFRQANFNMGRHSVFKAQPPHPDSVESGSSISQLDPFDADRAIELAPIGNSIISDQPGLVTNNILHTQGLILPYFSHNPNQSNPTLEFRRAVTLRKELAHYLLPGHSLWIDTPTFLISTVFEHPVISALPYYCRASEERVKWDMVMSDDQMIVGRSSDKDGSHCGQRSVFWLGQA